MELGLSIMVLDLEYKFQNDCLKGSRVIKPHKLVFFGKSKIITPGQKKCENRKSNLACL